MGEGLAVLASSLNTMRTIATRDIYETGFDEDVQTESNANQCPECDGRVTTNTVETVCEDCGLVIDEQRIDHGPEWRAYDDEECERTGAPLTAARHDRGLSTEIGRGTDAKGNELSGKKRQRLARMRREQTRGRFQSKAERNLAHGLGEVRRIASVLELSGSVRDQACQLFRSAQTEDLLRGRSIEAIAGASIYGACRCYGHSRLLDDVADAARVEQSRVTNAYKTLNTELGLPTQPVRPSEFIPRLASELEVPAYIRQRARRLAEQ
jgi:transcription initiation factor TFIIB